MDKAVVISGASRGIDAATVRYLEGQGDNVCVKWKKVQSVPNSLFQILSRIGEYALVVQADFSEAFIDPGGGK